MAEPAAKKARLELHADDCGCPFSGSGRAAGGEIYRVRSVNLTATVAQLCVKAKSVDGATTRVHFTYYREPLSAIPDGDSMLTTQVLKPAVLEDLPSIRVSKATSATGAFVEDVLSFIKAHFGIDVLKHTYGLYALCISRFCGNTLPLDRLLKSAYHVRLVRVNLTRPLAFPADCNFRVFSTYKSPFAADLTRLPASVCNVRLHLPLDLKVPNTLRKATTHSGYVAERVESITISIPSAETSVWQLKERIGTARNISPFDQDLCIYTGSGCTSAPNVARLSDFGLTTDTRFVLVLFSEITVQLDVLVWP